MVLLRLAVPAPCFLLLFIYVFLYCFKTVGVKINDDDDDDDDEVRYTFVGFAIKYGNCMQFPLHGEGMYSLQCVHSKCL